MLCACYCQFRNWHTFQTPKINTQKRTHKNESTETIRLEITDKRQQMIEWHVKTCSGRMFWQAIDSKHTHTHSLTALAKHKSVEYQWTKSCQFWNEQATKPTSAHELKCIRWTKKEHNDEWNRMNESKTAIRLTNDTIKTPTTNQK